MLPGYPAGVAATSPPYPEHLGGQPPRSTRPKVSRGPKVSPFTPLHGNQSNGLEHRQRRPSFDRRRRFLSR